MTVPWAFVWVSDGFRTRDNRDHNPVLCQLSYTHHGADGDVTRERRLLP